MEHKRAEGGGWILQVECILHCKCEFGLSTTYNTALNLFVHTLMHMRSRIGTRLRAWSLGAQTSCENGRFKERPAAAEAGRRLPRSPKRFYFFYFFSRGPLSPFCLFLLLCLEPRSIHLLNCALRLAIALQTSTETRSLELHLSVIGRTTGTFEGEISQRNTPHNAIVSQNKQQRE